MYVLFFSLPFCSVRTLFAGSSTVKLLIEVSTSKIGPGTVVSFTRKAGDVHAFRKLTERITADAAPALGLA